MIDVHELVKRLRHVAFRSKTGILLIPSTEHGHEADIAARLNIEHVDFVTCLLGKVPNDSDYVNVSLGGIIEELDQITNARSGMDCVLVSQIDVAATKLTYPDRARLWPRLLGDFPNRRKGLLLTVTDISEGSELLQDRSMLEAWLNADRIAKWTL